MIDALLAILACAAPSRSETADVLVVWSSAERRGAAPLTCARCRVVDVATEAIPEADVAVLVLDGHRDPRGEVLGAPEADLLRTAVARSTPELVVAAFCYSAELPLLAGVFQAAPSVRTVVASTGRQPWDGLRLDAQCARIEDPGCWEVGGDGAAHDRVPILAAFAELPRHRADLSACAWNPVLVRRHPTLACLPLVPPVAVRIEEDQLDGCFEDRVSRHVRRRCGGDGDLEPVLVPVGTPP